MSKLIICDIDGVVCDCAARIARYSDYKALERGDYNAYRVSMTAYNRAPVDEDIPILHGIKLLNALREFHQPERTIFLTSRGNESRMNTLRWLDTHVLSGVVHEDLIMRPEYEETEVGVFWREGEPKFCPIEFKRQQTSELMKNYEVVMTLDDHEPICNMYRELGVPSLHVKFPGVDCISKSGMAHESARAAAK